jgi:5-(carboxyamino)imidazole ribonucleotide mutase
MTDDLPTPNPARANRPRVGIIMGSRNDWGTMQYVGDHLSDFGVEWEVKVVSAHRTPDLLFDYAEQAESRGIKVIVAGAGGAAHLPGMCAAKTTLPVIAVPIESAILRGVDSLLSIVQMPAGIPVGTLAIGKAGAINAALFAIAILALEDAQVRERLKEFRLKQTQDVLDHPDPRYT